MPRISRERIARSRSGPVDAFDRVKEAVKRVSSWVRTTLLRPPRGHGTVPKVPRAPADGATDASAIALLPCSPEPRWASEVE